MNSNGSFSKPRNLVLLVWVLMLGSIGIAFHAHLMQQQMEKLRATVDEHSSRLMAPLKQAEVELAKSHEARWTAAMDSVRNAQAEMRNKGNLLSQVKDKVMQYVTKNKNADGFVKKLRDEFESVLQTEIDILQAKKGIYNLSVEIRMLVREKILKLPIDTKALYTHDGKELENLLKMDQEDNELIKYVRRKMLVTPSPRNVPYNLQFPLKKDRSEGQLPAFLDIFANVSTGGYFIECGAFDGEEISNTLDLEERYNWTGALIEGSPTNFKVLTSRNRKSTLVPACLSVEKHPTQVKFEDGSTLGKIFNVSGVPVQSIPGRPKNPLLDVLCLPFYTIYKALDQTEIDLFVLDIEGHENEVLRTIPFDKVAIHVLIAEFSHGVKFTKEDMKKFMLEKDFRLYEGSKQNYWPKENFMFIKKGCKYDTKHP
ncbi:uncharacterized protein LOC135945913 [Cloeon dipterum]|uniref:uncharacterized protein LOC135945913 n=1 Tax=Cloeon dipterum TaxID=197152 RepID=UPI0032204CDD